VELCHALGVDITGFIFAQSSLRAVSAAAAAAMPSGPSLRAGVFAGADVRTVLDTAQQARLDLIQLHGGEDEAFCRAVGSERVIKVLWPERLEPGELEREQERFAAVAAYFLLDVGISWGGSGMALGLEGLSRIPRPRPWFLAGGLGPRSLGPTLASFDAFAHSPVGVDLNSALEHAPGVKNHALIRKALTILNEHNSHQPTTLAKHP
jgi:phosphoribosylanthranilate isomerase